MFCPGPLREWRNAESYNYTFSGRYITYAFFGNLALDAGVRTEFDLASISVSRLDKTPPRMALWTCFTCRTADGRYHSHGDADLAAGSPEAMKGQNAAAADGSVRWIKGADLMIYSTATLPTYGPKKTLSAQ